MKTITVLPALVTLLAVCSCATISLGQEAQAAPHMPLIGENALAFTAETNQGTVLFPDDYRGK